MREGAGRALDRRCRGERGSLSRALARMMNGLGPQRGEGTLRVGRFRHGPAYSAAGHSVRSEAAPRTMDPAPRAEGDVLRARRRTGAPEMPPGWVRGAQVRMARRLLTLHGCRPRAHRGP
ncbi:Hypothetical protein A7982_10390 [Minicystis rosea]|nr:Hypothetical protein A7982_10390 [Minicystis rosea]